MSHVKLALRIAVSLLLVVLLFVYVVDARQVWKILKDIRPAYLLLAAIVVTLDRALMTYKWTLLLRVRGHRLPLLRGMTIYCAAMLWGSVLPATVGADVIRAVLVMRRGVGGADAVASIVVERMVGYVAAVVLGMASLVLLRSTGVIDAGYDGALYAAAALLLGTLALVAASMSASITGRAIALLPRAVRDSTLMHRLERMSEAYRSLGAARGTLAWFAVLTLAEQVFAVSLAWTLARGLGVSVNALVLLGVMTLALLISRLPISLDGLGVFESVFVGFMLLAGIPAASALAIAIAGRAVQLICFLPWWLGEVVSSGGMSPPEQARRSMGPPGFEPGTDGL